MKPADLVAALISAAADYTGLEDRHILGKRRSMELVEARWACFLVLHAKGWTPQAIGRAFKRDHGTVIHGLLRAKDHHGRRDEYFRELCQAVRDGAKQAA